MIILRVFLYLICFISIGWSILVFGGPPIIKRLISGYSEGALMPSGITVSPWLDVNIRRVDFTFQSEIAKRPVEGFSRAAELAWSLSGEKPFLEINLGPSVLKNYATANSVNIFTPSFQKIDWQNISVDANIGSLTLNSFAKLQSLNLAGNFNLETSYVSDINIEAEIFSAAVGSSTYSANVIRSMLSELNLSEKINDQLLSSTFAVEGITVSELGLTAPKAIFEVVLEKDTRNLKIDLQDLKLSKFGGSVENVKVDGSINQFNVLQGLQIDLLDSVFFDKSLRFPEIVATVNKLDDEQYEAYIDGNLKEFELSNSDTFLGLLPSGNFIIDLKLDREASNVSSMSRITFNTFTDADIIGSFETEFSSELLNKLDCTFENCGLANLNINYDLTIDDEWVQGSVVCPKSTCGLKEMAHSVRTSNTFNIFTILNQTNILSPMSSLYLYGAISSGQKINGGHELKFQF